MNHERSDDPHASGTGQPNRNAVDDYPDTAQRSGDRNAKRNNRHRTARSTGSSTTDPMPSAGPRKLRCAIYTRVSSDSGLEQDFNSLDAQREAAEAYIRSQAHEGWQLIRTPYNDGGFSGGSMERPALQQLLQAVRDRLIDIIVVYKVDRLTRSLADFAKLVELFDAHGVSFVSVTQSFNTTTSMGRLTLNVLLSFAQFEREVTGERIRDKIAASKKRGIWMGGVVPLGYRAEGRALHIVEEHATIIRAIFDRYLDLRSVIKLRHQLDADKIVMPIRIDGTGKQTGGRPFSRGHLNEILRNPLYIGKLTHKGQVHEGQHEPIIETALFNRTQSILTEQTQSFHDKKVSSDALLRDRLFDDNGNRMSPTWAQKRGKRWRYYVSRAIIEGRRLDAGSVPRIPAEPVEQLIIAALAGNGIKPDRLRDAIKSIRVHSDRIIVTLDAGDHDNRADRKPNDNRSSSESSDQDSGIRSDDNDALPIDDLRLREHRTIIIPWAKTSRLRKREIIPATGEGINANRPMRSEALSKLIPALQKAHHWLSELETNPQATITSIAAQEHKTERHIRMMLSLAFVAPDIIEAAIARTLPRGFSMSRLTDLPLLWGEQRRALGLSVR